MIQVRLHIDYRLHGVCDRPGRRTLAGTVGASKAITRRKQSSGKLLSTTARASSDGQPGQTFVRVVQHGMRRGRNKDRFRYPGLELGVHRDSLRGEGPRVSVHHETSTCGCAVVGGFAPPSGGNELAQPQCKCGHGRVFC